MRLLRNSILCLVLTAWVVAGGAYNLKTVTTKDGLSNSSILSFEQVGNKLMLIGTCDGVNCFDGTRIFPLPYVHGYRVSGNVIQNIVFDRENRGWILTNHGVGLIQRPREARNLPRFQGARGVRLNAEGRMIALQDSSLYYHTGTDTTFVRLGLDGSDLSDLTRDFVMASNYLYLFKADGIVRYGLQRNGDSYALGQRTLLTSETLQTATYDEGTEYLVDGDGMLWAFDTSTGNRKTLVSLRDDIAARGTVGSVKAMNGRIFVCFTASDVLFLEPQDGGYTKRALGLQVGVTASFKGHDNIMWLGTDGQGIVMFIDEPETRRSLTTEVLRLRQSKPYRAIYVDDEGTLWAGTKGDGLLEILSFDLNNISNNLERRFWRCENSGLAGNSVFALHRSDKLDGFWIATNGGISFRSRASQTIVNVPTEMPVEWVSAVCERADTLWMTTQGMGVYRAIISGTADHPQLTDMRHYVLDGGKKSSNYFFSMASASNGGPLYFGNRGMGLYVMQDDILKWIKPEVEVDDDNGLADIFAVLPTTDGLWIGTGCGLSFRSNDGHIEFYTMQNGMPNDVIHALAEDADGNVWVSTNKGLVRFLHGTRAMRLYNELDNMEVNEYSDGAAFAIGKTVYFGGINGVSIIQSDSAQQEWHPSTEFEFTSLTVNGQPVNINEYLEYGERQSLTLNFDQNNLRLHVSNFDFRAPGNYNFFYSFSKNGPWIDNGIERDISLTRLSPGRHTLYVKSMNRLTGEESAVNVLDINITPPWYLSWWAKMLYLLVTMAIGYVAYRRWHRHRLVRFQIQKTRDEQARRDEIYEQKMHFLTNLVHELNTPLTLVYGPCERILSHTGTDNFVRKYVHMIQGNMSRLNYLIQEIIDFRRMSTHSEELHIRSVAVGEWVGEFAGAFSEMADSNNISYEVDVDRQLVWNLDERLLTRICTNLISNAFKYSKPGATVRVQLHRTEGNQLLFSVYNTGKGIAEKDRQRIFDYYRVLENVEESNMPGLTSRNGLGMAICHASVMHLGGTIDIDSVEGEYACFVVHLPWADRPEGAPEEPLMPIYASQPKKSAKLAEERDVVETPASPNPRRERRQPRAHRDNLPTVLVIDDNTNILELLEDTLSDDYNVFTAQSGEQGLEVIKQLMPDLIVTDIMMPGLDGLELTQQLKQNKHTMHIPLVILSARRSDEQRVEGLESGADAYVSKPFSPQYLKATVARLLENRKVLKEYYNTSASAFTYQDGKLMTGEERQFRSEVVSIINRNLTNADFTPDDLARELAISQRNLYRKFSEAGLPTPKEYIQQFKIEHAARQLKTTNLTIQEIIYSSGYNSRSQFYTEFRKHYGITPKEYRAQDRKCDESLE